MVEVEECKQCGDHASRRMLFLHNKSSIEGSHHMYETLSHILKQGGEMERAIR